jgi:hypothetical protein
MNAKISKISKYRICVVLPNYNPDPYTCTVSNNIAYISYITYIAYLTYIAYPI